MSEKFNEAKADPSARPDKVAARNARASDELKDKKVPSWKAIDYRRAKGKASRGVKKAKAMFAEAIIEGVIKRRNKAAKNDYVASQGKKKLSKLPAWSHGDTNLQAGRSNVPGQVDTAPERQAAHSSKRGVKKPYAQVESNLGQRESGDTTDITKDSMSNAGGDYDTYQKIKKSKEPKANGSFGKKKRRDRRAGPLGHSRSNTLEKPSSNSPGKENFNKGTKLPAMPLDKINQTGVSSGKLRRAALAKKIKGRFNR